MTKSKQFIQSYVSVQGVSVVSPRIQLSDVSTNSLLQLFLPPPGSGGSGPQHQERLRDKQIININK